MAKRIRPTISITIRPDLYESLKAVQRDLAKTYPEEKITLSEVCETIMVAGLTTIRNQYTKEQKEVKEEC